MAYILYHILLLLLTSKMKKTIELNTLIEYNYLNKLHYKFLYNVISKTYYSYKQEVFYLKSSIKETRVVYHSNSKNKLEKSITENRLFISKDIFYLGDGMYFWTNERDCDYWYEKKLKKIRIIKYKQIL